MIPTIRYTILMLLSALILSGCRDNDGEDLQREMFRINVQCMWDNIPDASPEGMALLFYSRDNGKFWRFDIAGRKGGAVLLPGGNYDMIAINNDLKNVTLTDPDSYSEVCLCVKPTDREGIAYPTGMVYGAQIRNIRITPCGVRYSTQAGDVKGCPKALIRCYPDSLSTVYHVVFRDLKGGERISRAEALLKNEASSINLSQKTTLSPVVATLFPLQATGEGKDMEGSASCFSFPDKRLSPDLYIVVTTPDGISFTKKIDPGLQTINPLSPHNVYITITGFTIPDNPDIDSPDDVGIKVGVDGWEQFEIDLFS